MYVQLHVSTVFVLNEVDKCKIKCYLNVSPHFNNAHEQYKVKQCIPYKCIISLYIARVLNRVLKLFKLS